MKQTSLFNPLAGSGALSSRASIVRDILLVLTGSIVVALLAQVEIPFWPVPFTGQTLGVLGVAALLGRKRGTMSLLSYLAGGSLGLPVFAGGAAGLSVLLGPTAGYLVGFVAAAWVVGALADKGKTATWSGALAVMSLGTLVVFACGIPWLATIVGWQSALTLGFVPFLLNDVIKILLAAAVARGAHGRIKPE